MVISRSVFDADFKNFMRNKILIPIFEIFLFNFWQLWLRLVYTLQLLMVRDNFFVKTALHISKVTLV